MRVDLDDPDGTVVAIGGHDGDRHGIVAANDERHRAGIKHRLDGGLDRVSVRRGPLWIAGKITGI